MARSIDFAVFKCIFNDTVKCQDYTASVVNEWMSRGKSRHDTGSGKPQYSEKTYPSTTLFNENPRATSRGWTVRFRARYETEITIIIIIIIIINCNWVFTRWQWLFYMYTNMKRKVHRKFKSGGLHERHVVATWKLGNHLSIRL